jgi:hypothetical protein
MVALGGQKGRGGGDGEVRRRLTRAGKLSEKDVMECSTWNIFPIPASHTHQHLTMHKNHHILP